MTSVCAAVQVSQNCDFKDAVSDGQKHVFASNTQGGAFIEVFSIMKGVHVASIPTCGFPYLLDYVRRRHAQNDTLTPHSTATAALSSRRRPTAMRCGCSAGAPTATRATSDTSTRSRPTRSASTTSRPRTPRALPLRPRQSPRSIAHATRPKSSHAASLAQRPAPTMAPTGARPRTPQVALKTLGHGNVPGSQHLGQGNVLLDASIPNFALGLVLDLPEIHKVRRLPTCTLASPPALHPPACFLARLLASSHP